MASTRIATSHARPCYAAIRAETADRGARRRLRLGYVSADFRSHPVGWNVLGLIEAHDRNDQEFGLERLRRVVKTNRTRSAQEIGQEVLAKVTKWRREAEDDQTIVIVKAVTV